MSTREKELALTAEIEWLRDAVRTLGSELRAIEAALDDERINVTHTAAQVAAELRDKINELHAEIEAMRKQEPVAWFEKSSDLDAWFLAYSQNPNAETKPLYLAACAQTAPSVPEPTKCAEQEYTLANWKPHPRCDDACFHVCSEGNTKPPQCAAPSVPDDDDTHDPSTAAIEYALKADEGLDFLYYWFHGDFDVIRREWPDAPEDVFIGADPLYRAPGAQENNDGKT